MKKWSEMFPNGRHIYYEGDTPRGFVIEMKAKFKFDPSKDNDHWNEESGYCFLCPSKLLDKIYDLSKYPLGS
jgi:hypothetical protein